MPDNLVERVHQPAFGPGDKSKPAPMPKGTTKVPRPPVKEYPAPPRKK